MSSFKLEKNTTSGGKSRGRGTSSPSNPLKGASLPSLGIKRDCKSLSVFNFNHISSKLKEEEVTMLKKLYSQYHQKTWCYQRAYKRFKKIELSLNLLSIGLTGTGVVVGSVTLNPVILGSISGSGILLQGFLKMKNYNRKIEMCKFAYTSYQKILNKIRSYLRGEPYDIMNFVLETHLLDDQVTDLCPIVEKFKSKYKKLYE